MVRMKSVVSMLFVDCGILLLLDNILLAWMGLILNAAAVFFIIFGYFVSRRAITKKTKETMIIALALIVVVVLEEWPYLGLTGSLLQAVSVQGIGSAAMGTLIGTAVMILAMALAAAGIVLTFVAESES
jgi:uncharacterized membrane protein YozB (DUF420 family)